MRLPPTDGKAGPRTRSPASVPRRARTAPKNPEPPENARTPATGPATSPEAEQAARLPSGWDRALAAQVTAPYFAELLEFVAAEREKGPVYPPPEQVFVALQLTPLSAVRVVILGQDPYHQPGQAHGLAFSVPPGVPPPPSLRNIFKELHSDLGVEVPKGAGCLTGWATQGVLLLNTVLTVRAGAPGSHKGRGWERFTDSIIAATLELAVPPVFVLWGGPAQAKATLLGPDRHVVLKSAHPSPLSAWGGFFGSRPFSAVNQALSARGQAPIDWSIVT